MVSDKQRGYSLDKVLKVKITTVHLQPLAISLYHIVSAIQCGQDHQGHHSKGKDQIKVTP